MLLLACFVSLCVAHAFLVSPPARHFGDDLLKQGPCGEGLTDRFDLASVSLSPGPLTVVFRETIAHAGAPFRIALTSGGKDDGFDSAVLLDHVPHCDSCGATPRTFAVEVIIPDVRCDACAIQLVQVMTDKFQQPCPNPSGLVTSCGNPSFAYFSCANIRINGTSSTLAPSYRSFLPQSLPEARAPYVPGEDKSGAWQQRGDGVWLLTLTSDNSTTTSTTVSTSATTAGTTTTPSSQDLLPWKKWFIPLLVAGIAVAIAAIAIIFAICRRRHARRVRQPVKMSDFDPDDPSAFDGDF